MTVIAGPAEAILRERIAWTIATLDRLLQRGRVEGWLDGSPRPIASHTSPSRIEVASSTDTPLPWLALRLGLEDVELDMLWLLACIELSPPAARLAHAFGTAGNLDLTCQILLELLPISTAELAVLEALRLVEIADDPRIPLYRRSIRANDRVVDLARGVLDLDHELRGIATLHEADREHGYPEKLATAIAMPNLAVIAVGPDGAGRATLLGALAGSAGLGTLRVTTGALAREPAQLQRQLQVLAREAGLLGALLLFEDVDETIAAAIDRHLRSVRTPILATATETLPFRHRTVIGHRVEAPDAGLRRSIWARTLGDPALATEAAGRYALRPGAIIAAASNASAAGAPTLETIHAGVRDHLGEQLASFATRVHCKQTWDDLVLPVDQFEQVVELVARVRHRTHVLETWGFADKIGKGLGVAALLSGPPGTGKTMAAGLIANELGLDLYQVDLSKLVSKYIGETEKHLGLLFDAAESGQAVVLFDEADALFAKRSDVRSSNDRYANLESNYLLQRLESFTGIALLTTNHESSIDPAFRRRLAIHVRFPVPDETQREQLWRVLLPSRAAVATDVDPRRLAHAFEVSGGYIKNAVLRAAYLAAGEGTAITMNHLVKSVRLECESMGKVIRSD